MKITTLITAIGLLGIPLHGASFDCTRAKTTLEKTICGNAELDRADSRLGRAYQQLLRTLPVEARRRTRMDQRAWLPMREVHCLSNDPGCLIGVYEERIRFLEYRLSPVFEASPSGAVGGQYSIGESMTLRVYPLSETEVAVSIDGAELTAALWICQFSGRSRLNGNRAEIGEPGEPQIRFLFSEDSVDVREGSADFSRYCGAGGTLGGKYRKDYGW